MIAPKPMERRSVPPSKSRYLVPSLSASVPTTYAILRSGFCAPGAKLGAKGWLLADSPCDPQQVRYVAETYVNPHACLLLRYDHPEPVGKRCTNQANQRDAGDAVGPRDRDHRDNHRNTAGDGYRHIRLLVSGHHQRKSTAASPEARQ